MFLNIGDNTKGHMAILGIENFPFTEEELRKNFKSTIKQTHEDVGGTKDKARKVIEAREYLKNMVQENIDSGCAIKEPLKDDLFSNAVPCKRCNGTGAKRDYYGRPLTCNVCKGRGKVENEMFNPVIPRGAVLV